MVHCVTLKWQAAETPGMRWIGAGSGRRAVRGGSGGRSPRQPTCPISITSFCAGTGSLSATAYHSTNWNLFRYAPSRKLADAEKCRRIRSWLIARNTPAFPTHHVGRCVFLNQSTWLSALSGIKFLLPSSINHRTNWLQKQRYWYLTVPADEWVYFLSTCIILIQIKSSSYQTASINRRP